MDFEEMYANLEEHTHDFTEDGDYNCEQLYDAKLAKSILNNYYDDVYILEGPKGFMILYSGSTMQESYKDMEFMPDKGAGIDSFNAALGESYFDDEDYDLSEVEYDCPICDGGKLHYVESLGSEDLFRCDKCEHYFMVDPVTEDIREA